MHEARARVSIFSNARQRDAAPCPFHYQTGKRYSRDPVASRKIGTRCDATVTYYSSATFHYTSFHSTPRTYYWHVFPLALSCVPIGRIGKSFFLFPPRRHPSCDARRSAIADCCQYVLCKCVIWRRRRDCRRNISQRFKKFRNLRTSSRRISET